MALSKGGLIDAIATKCGTSKKASGEFLDAFIDVITKELKSGSSVTITGFGTFSTSHRAARMGVNPQDPSKKIKIKATTVAKFKAGKNLKEAVK